MTHAITGMRNRGWIWLFVAMLICSCHPAEKQKEATVESAGTPVTVTSISNVPLAEYIDLNATSAFLQKSYVKANTNGYLQSVHTQLGKYVKPGELLFTVKTKESQSIGNSVSILDSTLKFSGVNTITSRQGGYITQLDHQDGDYVQDGEQLAIISDIKSFVFLLNLPYELRPYLAMNKTLQLRLPDGVTLNGTVAAMMPTVDSVAQTQSIVIKVNPAKPIPENLIAKVRIVRKAKSNVPSLPREAVLTDESQSAFWVMKMMDSSTAVKVEVKQGMSNNERIEILSPAFSSSDRILLTGNYGLPDTAKVKIVNGNP